MRTFLTLMPLGIFTLLLLFVDGCSSNATNPSGQVVVYSSVDEEVARPLAEQFEKETGIQVKLVSDTEKAKCSGLLNRLIEEGPRHSVMSFSAKTPCVRLSWSNEELPRPTSPPPPPVCCRSTPTPITTGPACPHASASWWST